jgi:hypothetical protein
MPLKRSRAPLVDTICLSAVALGGVSLLVGTPTLAGATMMALALGLVPAAMLLRAGRLVVATARPPIVFPGRSPARARR